MPIYNTKGEYLRDTIESILNQTFSDFEFIIIAKTIEVTNSSAIIIRKRENSITYVIPDENQINLKFQGLIIIINNAKDLLPEEYAYIAAFWFGNIWNETRRNKNLAINIKTYQKMKKYMIILNTLKLFQII